MQNQCIHMLTQFFMCTYKPSNMNLIILLRSEFQFLQKKVNELHPHSSSCKRKDVYTGFVIYTSSIELLNPDSIFFNNIGFLCKCSGLSIVINLMLEYFTIPLTLMKKSSSLNCYYVFGKYKYAQLSIGLKCSPNIV